MFYSFRILEKPSGMESKSSGVIRRKAPSFRFYPYATGSGVGKEEMKKEVVQLGIEFSVCVAETMFLLCDDIRSMLRFCFKLWKDCPKHDAPVVVKLLRVMLYVYSKYIKPKKRAYEDGGNNSVQWELIRSAWMDFTNGTIVLDRLLGKEFVTYDDRLLSSAIAKYKQQVLKKLEEKLRSAKDVSEANGFARETIEPSISSLWRSLFDEESGEARPRVVNTSGFRNLFQPVLDELVRPTSDSLISSDWIYHSDREIKSHYSPYVLGRGFAKEELKEEVVQLGVELSLYLAESMFLLCDDIRSMLWFCYKLWRDAVRFPSRGTLVVERLLCVIHYVYSKDIKPKNGVYGNGGKSVQWRLVASTRANFDGGISYLEKLIMLLREDCSCLVGREFTSSVEEDLKKIEEKLRCAKAVSEGNGFARETMESSFLDLWKSVFDKEAKEAASTLRVIKNRIIRDLFLPLSNEAAAIGLPFGIIG